jgi:hypothetical protein
LADRNQLELQTLLADDACLQPESHVKDSLMRYALFCLILILASSASTIELASIDAGLENKFQL